MRQHLTVKTQMKCSILLHFIRVYSVCKGYKVLQTKEYNIFENYKLTPLDKICTMDYPKFTVSNQKDKSISIKRVKKLAMIHGTIVKKGAKTRNGYNQVPHLSQDTTWESNKNTLEHDKGEPRGEPFPSKRPQGSNEQK